MVNKVDRSEELPNSSKLNPGPMEGATSPLALEAAPPSETRTCNRCNRMLPQRELYAKGERFDSRCKACQSIACCACQNCGSTDLEKKGKNKDGTLRFGNICKACKAKREQGRYQRRAKKMRQRVYMKCFDVMKCSVQERAQASPTPDGLLGALRDFAFSSFLSAEEDHSYDEAI
jgi:hypothetical protein